METTPRQSHSRHQAIRLARRWRTEAAAMLAALGRRSELELCFASALGFTSEGRWQEAAAG